MIEGSSEKQEEPETEVMKLVPQSEIGDITESEMATKSE
jgi:hypothetical protein